VGYDDKMRGQADKIKGKTKEWVGDKTNNERLQAEGAEDQAAGRARQAGEQMKDAARDMTGR
jgi:uncharacterized protein YjbJ (UPF0337 family)